MPLPSTSFLLLFVFSSVNKNEYSIRWQQSQLKMHCYYHIGDVGENGRMYTNSVCTNFTRAISFAISLQAALKKSNLELEADLKVKLNNIEMLNEAAQMKDEIIKVIY